MAIRTTQTSSRSVTASSPWLSSAHSECATPTTWDATGDHCWPGRRLKLPCAAVKLCSFALWCLMKSPLIVGTDVHSLHPASLSILKNSHLIKVRSSVLFILQGCCALTLTWMHRLCHQGQPGEIFSPIHSSRLMCTGAYLDASPSTRLQRHYRACDTCCVAGCAGSAGDASGGI
jgi:hypothetical protein